MNSWNGTVKISWRLGVLVAIVGTIIGGSFWAGRFTSRVDDMNLSISSLTSYSQNMGAKVDLLRERQAADTVGDLDVRRRLGKIEISLVRIEGLIRQSYARDRWAEDP